MRLTLQRYLRWQALKQPPNADTCSYKHTRAYKQMSHKHAYTHSQGHVWQHAYSERVASCRRSLREQNTTCPPYLPLASQERLSVQLEPPHFPSLIPALNGSLLAIFSSTIYPRLCCSSAIAPSACVISKRQTLCNYFKSHQGFFLFWWESRLNAGLGDDTPMFRWEVRWKGYRPRHPRWLLEKALHSRWSAVTAEVNGLSGSDMCFQEATHGLCLGFVTSSMLPSGFMRPLPDCLVSFVPYCCASLTN